MAREILEVDMHKMAQQGGQLSPNVRQEVGTAIVIPHNTSMFAQNPELGTFDLEMISEDKDVIRFWSPRSKRYFEIPKLAIVWAPTNQPSRLTGREMEEIKMPVADNIRVAINTLSMTQSRAGNKSFWKSPIGKLALSLLNDAGRRDSGYIMKVGDNKRFSRGGLPAW